MNSVLVIGSLNYDETYHVDRLPNLGETVVATQIELSCGGKGANQAYAAACLGADTQMIGCVGDDAEGEIILNQLNEVGVNTKNIKKLFGKRTGKAVISVDSLGENNIIIYPGANLLLDYDESLMEIFKSADIVLIQNEIRMEIVEKMICLAAKLKKTVVYNPAPSCEISPFIFPMINYLIPNEHELDEIAPNKKTIREKSKYLISQGVENVIVTLGEKGAMLFNEKEEISVCAPKVKVINTVGAGDCFNGVFAALLGTKSKEHALEIAVCAASLSTMKNGAMESMPKIEEVMEFIEKKEVRG